MLLMKIDVMIEPGLTVDELKSRIKAISSGQLVMISPTIPLVLIMEGLMELKSGCILVLSPETTFHNAVALTSALPMNCILGIPAGLSNDIAQMLMPLLPKNCGLMCDSLLDDDTTRKLISRLPSSRWVMVESDAKLAVHAATAKAVRAGLGFMIEPTLTLENAVHVVKELDCRSALLIKQTTIEIAKAMAQCLHENCHIYFIQRNKDTLLLAKTMLNMRNNGAVFITRPLEAAQKLDKTDTALTIIQPTQATKIHDNDIGFILDPTMPPLLAANMVACLSPGMWVMPPENTPLETQLASAMSLKPGTGFTLHAKIQPIDAARIAKELSVGCNLTFAAGIGLASVESAVCALPVGCIIYMNTNMRSDIINTIYKHINPGTVHKSLTVKKESNVNADEPSTDSSSSTDKPAANLRFFDQPQGSSSKNLAEQPDTIALINRNIPSHTYGMCSFSKE